MIKDALLNSILNNKDLLQKIIPLDITAYGIFLGGSRFFNLQVDSADRISDYDLNIIVDTESYYKLRNIPDLCYDRFQTKNTVIHCFYIPIDISQYDFQIHYNTEFWLVAALKKFSIKDFIYIIDQEKIVKFINNVDKFTEQLKRLFKEKYYKKLDFFNSIDNYFLTKQNYLILYTSCLLDHGELSFEELQKITQLKTLISGNALPQELTDFIIKCFNNLKFYLQLYVPTVNTFLEDFLANYSAYKRYYFYNTELLPSFKIKQTFIIRKNVDITCDTGNFYNKATNECLGKSAPLTLYFLQPGTYEKLDKPVYVPEIIWRLN